MTCEVSGREQNKSGYGEEVDQRADVTLRGCTLLDRQLGFSDYEEAQLQLRSWEEGLE